MTLTPDNPNLVMPNSPASPVWHNGAWHYFSGYSFQGNTVSGAPTYWPGQSINMYDTNVYQGPNPIKIYPMYQSAETSAGPVTLTYPIYQRHKGGIAEDDSSYDEVKYSTSVAYQSEVYLSANEAVSVGSDEWRLDVKKSGVSSDKPYKVQINNDNGTVTTTPELPKLYYEHVQSINFEVDENDMEGGQNSGTANDPIGDSGNIGEVTGSGPEKSEGFSYDTAYITTTGVYDSKEEAQKHASEEGGWKVDGWTQIGWRGVSSNVVYRFDANGVAEVPRDWGSMTLEPIYEEKQSIAQVLFELNNTDSTTGVSTKSEDNRSVTLKRQDTADFDLLYNIENDGSIGKTPDMIDRSNSGSILNKGNRTFDFWYVYDDDGKAATNVVRNYVKRWNTKEDGTGVAITDNMSIEKIIEEAGGTENLELKTGTNGKQALVIYAQYADRSFDLGVNKKGQSNDVTLTDNGNGSYKVEKTVNVGYSEDDSKIELTLDASNLVPEYGTTSPLLKDSTLMKPRIFSAKNESVDSAGILGYIEDVRIGSYTWDANTDKTGVIMDGSGKGASSNISVALPAGKGTGNSSSKDYSTKLTFVVDAGNDQLGWNFKRTVTVDVTIHVEKKDWDLAFSDIDYEKETITFTGDNAAGAQVAGLKGVSTLGSNGEASLTAALESWAKNGRPFGTGSTPVTVSRNADNAHNAISVQQSIAHRPAAPQQKNVVTTPAKGTSNTGSISVTPQNKEAYQYRQGSSAQWQDMILRDGSYVAENLVSGSYQVRVKAHDNGKDAVETGYFAGAPLTVNVSRAWQVTFEFDVQGAASKTDSADIVRKALDNAKATDAIEALFTNNPTTVADNKPVSQIINNWDAVSQAMSGYTMTVEQVNGGSHTYGPSKPQTTHPVTGGNATVTFKFVRSNATLTFDYNGATFGNGISESNWNTRAVALGNDGTGSIGDLPRPSAGGKSWSELYFYKDGNKFEGWYTKNGTENGDWGDKVETTTSIDKVFAAGSTSATLYAKWAPTNYQIDAQEVKQEASYNTTYSDLSAQINVTDSNDGKDGDADPRILGLQITKVTAQQAGSDTATDIGQANFKDYFTVASVSSPTTAQGYTIKVTPNAALTPGVYTALVTISYDGGANFTGLDMGSNVVSINDSKATVLFTFTVNEGENADISFGTIDYVAETIEITGEQAPQSVDEAIALAKDKKLVIDGLPEGFDLTNKANWDDSGDTLKLVLTNALNNEEDETWSSDAGEATLTLRATVENFKEQTDSESFKVRAAAPEQHEQSDPRAKGEKAQATVRMADLANKDDRYEHKHGSEDSTWRAFNHVQTGEEGQAAQEFEDPAGTYPVRIAALATNGDTPGHFASRISQVEIEQWYRVDIAIAAKDWKDNPIDLYNVTTSGGVNVGQQIGHYSGSGAMVDLSNSVNNDITQLNANDRGWDTYANKGNRPGDNTYDSMYVPANGCYKLPVFGDVKTKSWETPGYDLVGFTMKTAQNTTEFGEDDSYQTSASPAITGDTTITLNFKERKFNVAWDVRGADGITEKYPNDLPTTQSIPWTEMVRSSMLNNWDDAVSDSSNWFVGGVKKPVDPVTIEWGSYVRDPWALLTNNNTYTGFQVAQAMASVRVYDPTEYLKNSGTNGAATSWRDSDTITFGTLYHENNGQYGVKFKIAQQDINAGFTVGNEGDTSRETAINANGTPSSSQVAYNGSRATEQDTQVPNSNYVFSGFFFDPAGLGQDRNENFNHGYKFKDDKNATAMRWTAEGTTEKLFTDVFGELAANHLGQNTADLGRPYPYDHNLRDNSYTEEGSVSEQGKNYLELHFPLVGSEGNYDPSKYKATQASTFPVQSKVDVTARIENADLNSTNTLVPYINKGESASGVVALSPKEVWTETEAGKQASENAQIANDLGWKITGVTQHDVTGPTGSLTDSWLKASVADANLSAGDKSAALNLSVPNTLAVGTYSTTLHVAYTYTSTTGASIDLYVHVPITLTVTTDGGTDTGANWMVTAHDYATSFDAAKTDLATKEDIANKLGFEVYHCAGENSAWEKVPAAESGDLYYNKLTVDPESLANTTDHEVEVTLKATGNSSHSDPTDVSVTRTVYLYDNEDPEPNPDDPNQPAYKVFSNDANVNLPDKDTKWMQGESSYASWLADLTDVTVYNTATYEPINTTFSVAGEKSLMDSYSGQLRNASAEQVCDADLGVTGEFEVSFNGYGQTGSATVTLVKAPYPGAPGDFKWDKDNSTHDVLGWTKAANSDKIPAIAVEKGYTPNVQYEALKNGAVVGSATESTTQSGLSENSEYSVRASHVGNRAYEGPSKDEDYKSITGVAAATEGVLATGEGNNAWTSPLAPKTENNALLQYDYEHETVTYEDAEEQGTLYDGSTKAHVTLSDGLSVTASLGDALVAAITNAEIVASGSDEGLMPLSQITKSVSDLAGEQEVSRKAGTPSSSFDLTVVGAESGIQAASGYAVNNVPVRAATPALSVAQPTLSTDPAVVSGFDPEYVKKDGTSLYQVSTDGKTWGSINFESGEVKSGETITLQGDADSGFTFNIPATYKGADLQFRVLYNKDSSTDNASSKDVDSHFASYSQTEPVNGGSFNVDEGASITANPFEMGVNELAAWGMSENGTFGDGGNEEEFLYWAAIRSGVNISNIQAGMSYELDYSNVRPHEGIYEVTYKLMSGGSVLSQVSVNLTVTTVYEPGDPNAYLSANSFFVGLDELQKTDDGSWLDWNGVRDNIAWARSGAHGVDKQNNPLVSSQLTFSVDGIANVSDLRPTGLEAPYTVHFVNDELQINASVKMYVFDHVGGQDQTSKYLIASNDFVVGANELVKDGSEKLSDLEAINRAKVTLFAKTDITKPIVGAEDNVAVDLSNAWGKTEANSPLANGAVFTAKAEAGAAAASTITITGGGSGTEDGAYQINAQNFHLGRDAIQGDIAQLLYESASVSGFNKHVAIDANGYGTTWSVTVRDNGSDVGLDPDAWNKDTYDVVFALLTDDPSVLESDRSVTVTMNLHDSGSSGNINDDRYAIFSENFEMDDGEYDQLFTNENNWKKLRDRAQVEIYSLSDEGAYTLLDENALAGLPNGVQVDASAFTSENCSAGVENAGPVVFYLGAASDVPPRSASFVTVHGGFTPDPDKGSIAAEHFVFDIDELSAIAAGTTLSEMSEGSLAAQLVAAARAKAVNAQGEVSAINAVKVGDDGQTWQVGNSYSVTFTAENGLTTAVSMKLFKNVSPGDKGFVIASNDFEMNESEAANPSADDVKVRGGVEVYAADNLQNVVASATLNSDSIAVDMDNLRGHKAGMPSSVTYSYTSGDSVDSNVVISTDGGTDPAPEGNAEIWANDIYTSQEALTGVDETNIEQFLMSEASLHGVKADGTAIADVDDVATNVVEEIDNNGEVSSSHPLSTDALKDGVQIQFTHDPAIAYTDNNGIERTLDAVITVHVRDNGGTAEPEDPNDPQESIYGMFADNFLTSVTEIKNGIATEKGIVKDGVTISDEGNYPQLRERANATATSKTSNAASVVLDDSDPKVVKVDASALSQMETPGATTVGFTNSASDDESRHYTTNAAVTVFSDGTTDDKGNFLYANDFATTYAELSAQGVNVKELILKGSQAVWGPNNAYQPTVEIYVGDKYVDLSRLASDPNFDGWRSPNYKIRLSHGNVQATIIMMVSQSSDPSEDGSVKINASSFATSLAMLAEAQKENDLSAWLWDQAQAVGTVGSALVTDYNAERIEVALNGSGISGDTAWPSERGTYQVTFTITGDKKEGSGAPTASTTVEMRVFDNASTDPDPNPGEGNENEKPVAGEKYVVFSDNFTVGKDERDADPTVLTDEELISRAGAVAYLTDNLYVPQGKVLVTDTGRNNLAAAEPGQTFKMPFTVEEEQTAQSVSTVYMRTTGSGGNIGDDSTARIFADPIYVGRNENPGSWELAELQQQLFDRAGVSGTITNADGTKEITLSDVTISVNGSELTANNIDWNSDSHKVTFSVNGSNSDTPVQVTVPMKIRDTGTGPGGEGDNNPLASIFGNHFTVGLNELNNLDEAALGSFLYDRGGIIGTNAEGKALTDAYNSDEVSITVNGSSLAQAIAEGWTVGTREVTYTVNGTEKSVTLTMTIRENSSEDGQTGDPTDPNQPIAHDEYVMFSSNFTLSLEERDAILQSQSDEELKDRAKVSAFAKSNMSAPLDRNRIYVPQAGMDALAGAEAKTSFNLPFALDGVEGLQTISQVTLYTSGSTVDDGNGNTSYLYANDFAETQQNLMGATDNGSIKDTLFNLAGVIAGVNDIPATVDDVKISVQVDGEWVEVTNSSTNEMFKNWSSENYKVRFEYGGITAEVSLDVTGIGSLANISATDFLVSTEEIANMTKEDLEKLFFNRAEVNGMGNDGVTELSADMVTPTIDGQELSGTLTKGTYKVTFTVDDSNGVATTVALTVYDNGYGPGTDPSVPGEGEGGDEGNTSKPGENGGWIVGNDFEVDRGNLVDENGNLKDSSAIEDIFKDLADITGANPDGSALDPDTIHVTINGKPVEDYIADGGNFEPGSYEIGFTTEDGARVVVEATITDVNNTLGKGETENANTAPNNDNQNATDEEKSALIKTGDVSNVLPFIAAALIALLGILFALIRRKKDEEEARQGKHAR